MSVGKSPVLVHNYLHKNITHNKIGSRNLHDTAKEKVLTTMLRADTIFSKQASKRITTGICHVRKLSVARLLQAAFPAHMGMPPAFVFVAPCGKILFAAEQ